MPMTMQAFRHSPPKVTVNSKAIDIQGNFGPLIHEPSPIMTRSMLLSKRDTERISKMAISTNRSSKKSYKNEQAQQTSLDWADKPSSNHRTVLLTLKENDNSPEKLIEESKNEDLFTNKINEIIESSKINGFID